VTPPDSLWRGLALAETNWYVEEALTVVHGLGQVPLPVPAQLNSHNHRTSIGVRHPGSKETYGRVDQHRKMKMVRSATS